MAAEALPPPPERCGPTPSRVHFATRLTAAFLLGLRKAATPTAVGLHLYRQPEHRERRATAPDRFGLGESQSVPWVRTREALAASIAPQRWGQTSK